MFVSSDVRKICKIFFLLLIFITCSGFGYKSNVSSKICPAISNSYYVFSDDNFFGYDNNVVWDDFVSGNYDYSSLKKILKYDDNNNFFDFYVDKDIFYEKDELFLKKILKGKRLSILGDSISTYDGYSNDVSINYTLNNNISYYYGYNSGLYDVNQTWWKMVTDYYGMEILVNNSWSGSRVSAGFGKGFGERSVNLHNNYGIYPDIIAIYLGTNDFDFSVPVGDYSEFIIESLLVHYEDNLYDYSPSSFSEAYAIMLYRIISQYEEADLFCFTLLPNEFNRDYVLLNKYNDAIKKIANYFGVSVVDLHDDSGINQFNSFFYYNDEYEIHPNLDGMRLIADNFALELRNKYVN